ncbi:RDD family protein [Pelagibius litoralis]|uniref:RDD family protein n=1 Tax=Pelagibius litoralis TaxID=374515 RepID=A0A967C3P2_9PROT|nr:RDD family protein [Pelagibius litoralis]NIA67695.1 RDD family protein [Pelagibius litoralis]
MKYAGFWARVLAGLIDVVALIVPSITIVLLSEPELISDPSNHQEKPLTYFLLVGLWAVYQGGMESSRLQATLGKLAIKVYVTDLRGRRLSFPTAAVRCWPMYLGNLALGLNAMVQTDIGDTFVMAALGMSFWACLYIVISPQNQGLHDWISGTFVLAKQGPVAAE